MINLEELAQFTQENFTEVTLEMPGDIGQIKVKVYQTSPPLIWTLTPLMSKPVQPIQPTVEMKLGSGRIQMRPAKESDPEFEKYQLDLEKYRTDSAKYEAEMDALQDAAALVFPLKDVEYPSDLSKPPPSHEYLERTYPEHELLRKAWWLKVVLLSIPSNYAEIQTAIIGMNAGTNPTRVDDIKKNSESTLEEGELE
jgi:hypothetical protein